ncbi:MAG TPA: cytochrome c/FTR1 family iron permease [Gemmatimonadaceae bacterium]|nr:cytochrome c/FTR1 family iron permease [Gemmatimonadaceae bacterium]
MKMRVLTACVVAAVLPQLAAAQEHPVRRVANIVNVAVEEYAKGVDERGRVTSAAELSEATDFLADAKAQVARLSGDKAIVARVVLDSIIAAVASRVPPSHVKLMEQRFAQTLGSEAALELPNRATDLAEGRRLFGQSCASCHGLAGRGDGPAAAGMNPKPPAIGDGAAMRDVSPATMYRIVSVGIAGTPMTSFAASMTPEQRWNIVSYLMSLRTTTPQLAEGEGLYTQRCMQCHGALGAGDGAFARSLSKLPPEIGSFAWQSSRSDAQVEAVIREGMPGTAMPASADLTPRQVQSLTGYLRTLSWHSVAAGQMLANQSGDAVAASRQVIGLLEQSLTAVRSGRSSDASDKAFDAYIAFEPMETPARARNPGLVASMERLFADFKGAVRSGDVRGAERARDAIETNMPAVLELTRPTGSGLEAFWQSLLIILREGVEAILVIGAVVAFLLKTGHRERLRSVWWGVAWGVLASAATAVILKTVLSAMPASREVLEGLTMLVAVAVLFSVSYWLISKVEAAKWQQFIRDKVTVALEHGGGTALAFVAFLAVYREGAETALFYQTLFNEGTRVAVPIALGILAGGVALAVIFTLFYRFGVRVPLRPFFGVTSVLLYYMAFVFLGKGIRELQEGNIAPITSIPGAPHVEALGLYPTVETLLAQLVLVVLFVFALVKTFWPKRSVALPTIPSDPTATALVEAQLAEMRSAQETLSARLAALEAALQREESSSRAGD